MKKVFFKTLLTTIAFVVFLCLNYSCIYAEDLKETLQGVCYDMDEDSEYNLTNAAAYADQTPTRFYIKGDFKKDADRKDGYVSYAINSGNLLVCVDNTYGNKLLSPDKEQDWHIISDSNKTVNGYELGEKIVSGAIVVQTSKDGKTGWKTVDSCADFNNKMDSINNREINGKQIKGFYETNDVQKTSGCFYRVIVAYKLEHEVEPTKIWKWDMKNKEAKERVEEYKFYAYDPSVPKEKELKEEDAYWFYDVFRVNDQDGFDNPQKVEGEDPHSGWKIGKFCISDYTEVKDKKDNSPVVFVKTPKNRVSLWFKLNYDLDKCYNKPEIKVDYTQSGSDTDFDTGVIKNVGKGMLIVEKRDVKNHPEKQIYTNFLDASATAGANTRIDLFEEGDYRVTLDYQLHYDKDFVFGTTTSKTLSYKVPFEFRVRNGDISLFLRDLESGQFISNAEIAERGFKVDLANSKYLSISVKREILNDSLDGLVPDTTLTETAKDGDSYTLEGIYTVTAKNPTTGESVEKKIYVGDRDIMKAHMTEKIPLSEIKERLELGAYIDDLGHIIDPTPTPTPEPEEEIPETTDDNTDITPQPPVENNSTKPTVSEPVKEDSNKPTSQPVNAGIAEKESESDTGGGGLIIIVVSAIAIVLCLFIVLRKKRHPKEKD